MREEFTEAGTNGTAMADLLVPLYSLPPRAEGEGQLPGQDVVIRRANTFELSRVSAFIAAHFGQAWADEMAAAFARQPVAGYLAIADGTIVGFAAFDVTRRAFFGPTGVDAAFRGRGIGRALLIAALWGLHDMGYAYGIIGAAGPTEFYKKAVGAIVIPHSTPGVYTDMLKRVE